MIDPDRHTPAEVIAPFPSVAAADHHAADCDINPYAVVEMRLLFTRMVRTPGQRTGD